MIEKIRKSRGPLIAHLVWGTLNFAICALLALSKGGHPPAIAFLPLVAIVWAVGHAAIWAAGRIAARGRRIASVAGNGARAWPPGLIVVLVLTGLAGAIGIIQLVVSVAMRELYPSGPLGIWGLTMAIWIAHGACFAGVLSRKRWARYLSTVLALGWIALLAVQIVDHLVHARRIEPLEMTIAAGLVLILAAFASHLMTSKRIRPFLSG